MMKTKRNAQAMIELAVFGSVLLFLIGSIASSYLAGGFQQNAQIYAMREAMLRSYKSSHEGDSSRVSGSFLMFEDRLQGNFGKFGTLDRQPVVFSGSGMLSNLAVRPVDWKELKNIAALDLIINGKAFILRTMAFVNYVFVLRSTNGLADNATVAATTPQVQIIKMRPTTQAEQDALQMYCPNTSTPCNQGEVGGVCGTERTIELFCKPYDEGGGWYCPNSDGNMYCQGETTPTPETLCYWVDTPITCPVATEENVLNAYIDGCLANPNMHPAWDSPLISCQAGTDIQRRRLTREWFQQINYHPGDLGAQYPAMFRAIMKTIKKDTPGFPFNEDALFPPDVLYWRKLIQFDYTRDGDPSNDLSAGDQNNAIWRWWWTDLSSAKGMVNDQTASFPQFDVDGDLQEETMYTAHLQNGQNAYPGTYWTKVLDGSAGDLDQTQRMDEISDPNEVQGIRMESKIYGRPGDTGPLTYFNIKEGKIYAPHNDGKPLSMSEVRKNQFDVVERIMQLNPEMTDVPGFLYANGINKDGTLQAGGSIEAACIHDPEPFPVLPPDRLPDNSCCMRAANIQKTCFDKTTKTLFIRSRLSDKRGHKWQTDTTSTWKQTLGGT